MESNMDLITDMFSENLKYEDELEFKKDESKEYYIGKAEYILKNLPTEYYFDFFKIICKNYNILNKNQQQILNDIMGIKKEIHVVEKIKYVNNKKKK